MHPSVDWLPPIAMHGPRMCSETGDSIPCTELGDVRVVDAAPYRAPLSILAIHMRRKYRGEARKMSRAIAGLPTEFTSADVRAVLGLSANHSRSWVGRAMTLRVLARVGYGVYIRGSCCVVGGGRGE